MDKKLEAIIYRIGKFLEGNMFQAKEAHVKHQKIWKSSQIEVCIDFGFKKN